MQEQMNKAMAQLSETVGEDVPTFNEVRDKIEARYAKANGMAEGSVESRMLEVERATRSTEAHARLSPIATRWAWKPAEPEPHPQPPPQRHRRGPQLRPPEAAPGQAPGA